MHVTENNNQHSSTAQVIALPSFSHFCWAQKKWILLRVGVSSKMSNHKCCLSERIHSEYNDVLIYSSKYNHNQITILKKKQEEEQGGEGSPIENIWWSVSMHS